MLDVPATVAFTAAKTALEEMTKTMKRCHVRDLRVSDSFRSVGGQEAIHGSSSRERVGGMYAVGGGWTSWLSAETL